MLVALLSDKLFEGDIFQLWGLYANAELFCICSSKMVAVKPQLPSDTISAFYIFVCWAVFTG